MAASLKVVAKLFPEPFRTTFVENVWFLGIAGRPAANRAETDRAGAGRWR